MFNYGSAPPRRRHVLHRPHESFDYSPIDCHWRVPRRSCLLLRGTSYISQYQVSNLNNNASSLSDQIAALKAEIANLTNQISHLQRINSQLNQTSLQFQSLETQ